MGLINARKIITWLTSLLKAMYKYLSVSDTSVKHSPNFDWVVAHVGSCFPNTVITRVLSCGLKDFCQNKSYVQGCESPKLKSVVGILGHLANSHSEDIQKALLDLFNVTPWYYCFFFCCYGFVNVLVESPNK